MISVNRLAVPIVEDMLARAEILGLGVQTLPCGARLLDLGLRAPGGLEAGRLAAEATLGGLGRVSFQTLAFGDLSLPGVCVAVDQPELACMAAQYAGWGIDKPGFFAIGSGPARALSQREPVFQQLDYRDDADVAVLLLETRQFPTDEMAAYLARKCRVEPACLTLILAPAACVGGMVQLVARVAATGLHKLYKLGFDVRQVLHAVGSSPLPPVVPDEDRAGALANDAVLYGGRVVYHVRADDAELAEVIRRVPSSASPSYGTPFWELYQSFGGFYAVDPLIFCPAQVTFNNLNTGRVFTAGAPHLGILRGFLE